MFKILAPAEIHKQQTTNNITFQDNTIRDLLYMNETNFKFELFFELSPDLLCIAGFDGYFKKINPAVSNLFGYTMEELYARPINDFVYDDDKEITAKLRKELTKQPMQRTVWLSN